MTGVAPVTPATVVAGERRSPGRYFLPVFGWSWMWWAVVASTGVPVSQPPASVLFLVGGLGPGLAAMALVFRDYSTTDRWEFWRRIWDPRRIGGKWWLMIAAAGAGPTVVGWLLTQADVGFGTGLFWMFLAAIVAQTFLYVWIVTNTGGSILAAIVFHALTSLAGEILNPSPAGRLVALVVWVAAAAVVTAHWPRRRLRSSTRAGGGVSGRDASSQKD